MSAVLLIDDEPWGLRGLKNSCKWEDYGFDQVLSSTDPAQAKTLLLRAHPKIVISDIRMPELSGIDLLKLARCSRLHSEFIFVSGFSEFSYAQEAVNNGAFAYLLKPIDPQILQETVKKGCVCWEQKQTGHGMPDVQPDELTPGYCNPIFIELLTYVKTHTHENITLTWLSETYHLNPTYISDLFKKSTGKSFSRYLANLRIQRACVLLRTTHQSVQDISEAVGYHDYGNFVRAFKQIMHTTPVRYRNQENIDETKSL